MSSAAVIPPAKAFEEGLRLPPVRHGGFEGAFEGLAGAMATGAAVVLVSAEPGLGKSTLLHSLALVAPKALRVRFLGGGLAGLPGGETVKVSELALSERCGDGVVLAVELHEGRFSAEEVQEAAEDLFDLACGGVSVVAAGGEEDVEALSSLPVLAVRDPVRLSLGPVPVRDVFRYVHGRLSAAGVERWGFSEEAATAIGEASGGNPVKINALCRRVIASVYLQERDSVGLEDVEALEGGA